MKFVEFKKIFPATTCLIIANSGLGEGQPKPENDFKNSYYIAGASLSSIDFSESNKATIEGNSLTLQFGYGKIYPYYITHITFDYIHGPYAKSLDEQLNIDFSGTGVTWSNFFQINSKAIQKVRSTRGISLAISYQDHNGKSFGSNLKAQYGERSGQPSYYELNHTAVYLNPGFFYSWHTKPRVEGNDPELLMTRIEGHILNFSFKVPIYSKYKTSTTFEYNADTDSKPPKQQTSGGMSGIGFEVSISTLLGV